MWDFHSSKCLAPLNYNTWRTRKISRQGARKVFVTGKFQFLLLFCIRLFFFIFLFLEISIHLKKKKWLLLFLISAWPQVYKFYELSHLMRRGVATYSVCCVFEQKQERKELISAYWNGFEKQTWNCEKKP